MLPSFLYNVLIDNNIDFFTGVPDSVLKHFCQYVTDNAPESNHVIAANEGNAVGIAIGNYLSSGKPSLVYMQNSGLGNVVNPITSMADNQINAIPMFLLVGWRGEIGTNGKQIKDEPQHTKMGQITLQLLDLLNISYEIIDSNTSDSEVENIVQTLLNKTLELRQPVAIIVKKNSFEPYLKTCSNCSFSNYSFSLSREESISTIISALDSNIPIVSTTGKASRELYELRVKRQEAHHKDFLTIGAMGHTSQIAFGVANNIKSKVVCLDGDGSVIMHLGALAVNATKRNLVHVVLNNGAHDSVGGQPTMGYNIDLCQIAKAHGYSDAICVETKDELERIVKRSIKSTEGPFFIEVRCKKGSRSDLGRPKLSTIENKNIFMEFLKNI